jgi:regulator of protease activity HflC (stomatin/prohibitin superfamily)
MAINTFVKSVETSAKSTPGLLAALLALALAAGAVFTFLATSDLERNLGGLFFSVLLLASSIATIAGFYFVQPNEGMVVTQFGAYQGTDRKPGLRWVLPWMGRKAVSLRVRNITSDTLKVNDLAGNPVEIAANVVWRVQDSAQAMFDVDDYESFAKIEIDTALRDIASHFKYDHAAEGELSLRGNSDEVANLLRERLDKRLSVGGMQVDEARISHLAYAPEIASAMLRRQQAEAVLAARSLIVTGAVGMVEQALDHLEKSRVVSLDDERKAQMVSNLLVVLCSDRDTQPVINAGTLY